MLRSRLLPNFNINGYYIRVNKLTVWQLPLIGPPRFLGDNEGQVEIAPDRTALLGMAPLLLDLHDEWSCLTLHRSFLDDKRLA
jgi:hypothetical protein